MQDEPRENSPAPQRLDKWLFHARIVRTRAEAAALVKAGHVRVNGARSTAPSHPVRLDDVLTIALDSRVRVVLVAGFARGGEIPMLRAACLPKRFSHRHAHDRAFVPMLAARAPMR